MDPQVILTAARSRQDVTAIEALMLFQDADRLQSDIHLVASELNRRMHEGTVTFSPGKLVHYTNLCRAGCAACSFFRRRNDADAFLRTPAQVVREIRRGGNGFKRIDLQGGLNPNLTFDNLVAYLRTLQEEFPGVEIWAFSPVEVAYYAKRSRLSARRAFELLHQAGLRFMPGTGAEILNDKVRKKIVSDMPRTEEWVHLVRSAHQAGIRTSATMLFGHIEDEIHLCEHLEILRTLQRETGGFTEFVAVPYFPAGTALANRRKVARLETDDVLLVVALSRIFFGRDIPIVSAPWHLYGFDTAVRALEVGANDLGLVAVDREAVRNPVLNGTCSTPLGRLVRLVERAGFRPRVRETTPGPERKPTVLRSTASGRARAALAAP